MFTIWKATTSQSMLNFRTGKTITTVRSFLFLGDGIEPIERQLREMLKRWPHSVAGEVETVIFELYQEPVLLREQPVEHYRDGERLS